MKPVLLHDKAALESFLLRHRELNVYTLGDLDDFFWPYTTWYALQEHGEIKAVNLLYSGGDPAVLLAICNDNEAEMRALLEASLPLLPPRFYSHLSPGLEEILRPNYSLEHHGELYKMALRRPSALDAVNTDSAAPLTSAHLGELLAFYAASYPGNWFDPRMLGTGEYFGIRDAAGALASVAGVHVYSPTYRIAALGNIATHPAHRGRGLGTAVTAALCKHLLLTVDAIGLNVRTDNAPAIHAYEKLGFEKLTTYNEFMVALKYPHVSVRR